MLRLIELTHKYFQEKIIKKGEIIQKQGQESDQLLIIISGKVGVFKTLNYFDEHDQIKKREVLIMEVSNSEIVGEDPIWYERPCQYSARVTSPLVKCIVVNNDDFIRYFNRVIEL